MEHITLTYLNNYHKFELMYKKKTKKKQKKNLLGEGKEMGSEEHSIQLNKR